MLEQFSNAEWIWMEDFTGKNITCRFRKSFTLKTAPKSAEILVTAHHFFHLWVNGTLVSGLVSPVPSVFQKRKWTLRYDLSEHLAEGENVLAFTVLYLGDNGQNRTKGCPGLIFEADILLAEGEHLLLASGPDCRCSNRTEYVHGLPMREPRGMSGSTKVDASKGDLGWELPGFDDSGWEHAALSPARILVAAFSPQEVPEGAVSRVWEPACIHEEPGLRLYDAGEVLAGYVRVRLRGKPGEVVCLRYGELLKGQRKTYAQRAENHPATAMRVERSVVNDKTEFYLDEYVVQGAEEELWEENFTYKAFRYIEVTGLEKTELLSLEVMKAGTDAPCLGDFHCDEPFVNDMVRACIETQKNGILGMLVDCPHREQAEYLGDSLVQSRLLVYNFPAARSLLRKALTDFADNQLTEGYFPFVAPVDWVKDNQFQIRMPEYDLLYSEILWTLRFYYDDLSSVREFYPTAAKTAAYYLSLRDSKGLIPNLRDVSYHISDWPYPTIDEDGDALFVINAYSLQGLKRLADLAALLHLDQDRAYWLKEWERTRRAMRDAFFDPQVKLFRDTPVSKRHHPGVNTLALELGLFLEDETEAAYRYLETAPYETGVILSFHYLSALCRHGGKTQAYQMLTDRSVRWGRMIAEGSKTIWEGFEDIESHSHAWNCYPVRLFQEFLLGVSCEEPGFRRVAISPFFPEGIGHMSGSVSTILGDIHLDFVKDGEFSIELPDGMTAIFSFAGYQKELSSGSHALCPQNK